MEFELENEMQTKYQRGTCIYIFNDFGPLKF